MMRQRAQQKRRYMPSGPNAKKKERDPYLFLLIVQLLVCAVLVAASYVTARMQPAFLEELGTGYQRLINAKELSFSNGSVLSELPRRYVDMRDGAADAAADMITRLIAPDAARTEPVDQPAENENIPEPAQADDGGLNGAGGWMGVGDSKDRTAPSSCDFSPIIFSAWLEPPVSGKITSMFGYREHPITGADDFHRGVDISALEGTGIYAPLPGRVSEVSSSAIYGNYITLDHGNGLQTTYCHCSSIIARVGENLRKGERIATVGSTGISTGPHVHFEIIKNGKYYNPAWVLDGMGGYGI